MKSCKRQNFLLYFLTWKFLEFKTKEFYKPDYLSVAATGAGAGLL